MSERRRYVLWICDHCGDHAEVEPGALCEVCCEGTVQTVEFVPADAAGTLTEELVLRLVDVVDVLATVETDEDGETHTAGLLSALDYALRGASGCVDPDEWQARRRQALAKHGVYLGLGESA